MYSWRVYALVLALGSVGCEPPCLRGHYETRHVSQNCYPREFMKIDQVPLYMVQCDPPYDCQHFVCDQYQAEKP